MPEGSVYTNNMELLEFVHVNLKATLEVRSLVLVDHVFLCKLIEHAHYSREESACFLLACQSTQFTHCVTGSLEIILVTQSFSVVRTNACDC